MPAVAIPSSQVAHANQSCRLLERRSLTVPHGARYTAKVMSKHFKYTGACLIILEYT